MIKKKYAWFPVYVNTWRPKKTKAIIWLQQYYERNNKTYCLKLGFFSYEF